MIPDFVLGPSVLLNPINIYMFLENLNGRDPSYERNVVVPTISRKKFQMQNYRILKNDKSCWRLA